MSVKSVVDDIVTEPDNPIEAFYKDTTILITGGTGFLGTVLVEKLLRCFEIKKIFLLVRSKNNESAIDRVKKFTDQPIFDLLRNKNSMFEQKLIPVEVDYTMEDLKIDSETLKWIQQETQVVFNIVASVRFNELLTDAIDINVLGTKKVVKLTLGLKCLKSFVHVSTLYSNCNRFDIDEKIYNHCLSYHQLIHIGKVANKGQEKINDEIFENLPNTYTLTKHFAEKLVAHETFFIPSGIFRPPVVTSNYKDFPGFTDNLNGPSGIIAWTVKGYVHCIYGHPKKRSNIVPVDYCINALAASAWDIHENYQERLKNFSSVPIYNYIFHENNLTWAKYMSLVPLGFHTPLEKSIWYYSYYIVSTEVSFRILNFILHFLPACLADLVGLFLGRKMIYRKAYQRTEKILLKMSFFGLRQWNFGNKNIRNLLQKTKNFRYKFGTLDFDMRCINWNEFFCNYVPGIKRCFFKENCENVKNLQSSYRWMKRVHITIKYLIYLVLLKKVLKIVDHVFKLAMRMS